MLSRRVFLSSATASAVFAGYPVPGFTRDLPEGRICLVILEGGMDGLACVPPVGDGHLSNLRPNLLVDRSLEINPFFALHPSLRSFSQMLAQDEAAIVHAAAFPYTRRSHFEGQNIVESGLKTPFASKTGWLGRAMDLAGIAGRAFSLDTPLVIRGAKELDSFFPANLLGSTGPDDHLLSVMAAAHGSEISSALEALATQVEEMGSAPRVRDPAGLALAAGKAMALEGGPRIAVIRVDDFDTHANQGADDGQHARQLRIVDEVFAGLKRGLGAEWSNSIILTATEFGRTVAQNGSSGTDHGYGSAGLLAGGLLKRDSLIANWPGLSPDDLYEERDLMATMDYREVCAACIERALGIPHDVVAERVFLEPGLGRVHDLLFA